MLVRRIDETPGRWDVKVDVLVNRDSQKPMVIGRGAQIVRSVRKASEKELSKVFDIKVALELTVRTERNWMKNESLLMQMGYLGDLV